jgi:hypothetical protein
MYVCVSACDVYVRIRDLTRIRIHIHTFSFTCEPYAHIYAPICTYPRTHLSTYTNSLSLTHTHIYIYLCAYTNFLSFSLTHTYIYIYVYTIKHTHSLSLTHTYTHSLAYTHTHTHSLTYTHTLTYLHTHAYTHTHVRTSIRPPSSIQTMKRSPHTPRKWLASSTLQVTVPLIMCTLVVHACVIPLHCT